MSESDRESDHEHDRGLYLKHVWETDCGICFFNEVKFPSCECGGCDHGSVSVVRYTPSSKPYVSYGRLDGTRRCDQQPLPLNEGRKEHVEFLNFVIDQCEKEEYLVNNEELCVPELNQTFKTPGL